MNLKLKCPNLVACLEVLNLESKVKQYFVSKSVLSDLLMCVNVTGQNYIEVTIFKPRLILNFLFMN